MADKQYVSKFIGENDEEYWVRDAEAIHPQFTLRQWKKVWEITSGQAESEQVIHMGDTYEYSSSDIIDIYLNGLKLTITEYSITGIEDYDVIRVTLIHTTFVGTMEVVATKLAEEV